MNWASLRFAVSLCMLAGLCACNTPSNNELIVGQWQFEYIDIEDMKHRKPIEASEYQELLKLQAVLKTLQWEFHADSTYQNTGGGTSQPFTGVYWVTQDGKFLESVPDSDPGKQPTSKRIVTLTNDTLRFVERESSVTVFSRIR